MPSAFGVQSCCDGRSPRCEDEPSGGGEDSMGAEGGDWKRPAFHWTWRIDSLSLKDSRKTIRMKIGIFGIHSFYIFVNVPFRNLRCQRKANIGKPFQHRLLRSFFNHACCARINVRRRQT